MCVTETVSGLRLAKFRSIILAKTRCSCIFYCIRQTSGNRQSCNFVCFFTILLSSYFAYTCPFNVIRLRLRLRLRLRRACDSACDALATVKPNAPSTLSSFCTCLNCLLCMSENFPAHLHGLIGLGLAHSRHNTLMHVLVLCSLKAAHSLQYH